MGALTNVAAAIEDVLTLGHGNSRTLGVTDRFKVGLHPQEDDAKSSTEAHEHKRVWVEIFEMATRKDTQEIGGTQLYDIRVSIVCSYFTGHPERHVELRASFDTAADDFVKIRRALCFPGNMTLDVDGNVTGLAGGALVGVDAKWARTVYDAEARSLKCTAVFKGIVESS